MFKKRILPFIMLLSLIFSIVFIDDIKAFAETIWKNMSAKEEVNPDKTWTISFNTTIDAQTVTNDTIFVEDEQGTVIKTSVSLSDNHKQVIVAPPRFGYKAGEYTLKVTNDIKGEGSGKNLLEPVTFDFKVKTYTASELLDKTMEANKNINNMVFGADVEQTITQDGQSQASAFHVGGEISQDPVLLYYKISDQLMGITFYTKGDAVYMKQSGDPNWYIIPEDEEQDYTDISQYTFSDDISRLKVLADEFTVTETDTSYELSLHFDENDSEKVKTILGTGLADFDQEALDIMTFKEFSYNLLISKDKFYLGGAEINMNIDIDDGVSQGNLLQHIKADYGGFNQVYSAKFPTEEELANAIPLPVQ